MKKTLSEYKVFIGIGILVIIFGLLLWWPQGSNKKQVTSKKTRIVGELQRAELIDWGGLNLEIPAKMAILKSKSGFINGGKLDNLKIILGMEGVGATKSDDNYVIYKNDKSVLYIKLKERQIDYQIRSKQVYEGDRDPTIAINNFKDLIFKISNRPIGEIKVEYFKNEFRATRTNIFGADFLELTANFVYKGIPIISFNGQPSIKAQYNFAGKLGRLLIYNPFEELADDKEVELIKINQVKQMPAAELPIFGVIGNRDYAMSTGEEIIEITKTDGGQISYVYEPLTNEYLPYLVVNGRAYLKSGDTEIIFGVPLIKP